MTEGGPLLYQWPFSRMTTASTWRYLVKLFLSVCPTSRPVGSAVVHYHYTCFGRIHVDLSSTERNGAIVRILPLSRCEYYGANTFSVFGCNSILLNPWDIIKN